MEESVGPVPATQAAGPVWRVSDGPLTQADLPTTTKPFAYAVFSAQHLALNARRACHGGSASGHAAPEYVTFSN